MKRHLKALLILLCLAVVATIGIIIFTVRTPNTTVQELYLRPTTPHEAAHALDSIGCRPPLFTIGMKLLRCSSPRPGHYIIAPRTPMLTLCRRLRGGLQDPVRLNMRRHRHIEQCTADIASQLMLSQYELDSLLADTLFMQNLVASGEPLHPLSLMIPTVHQVYWSITPENLLTRLATEHQRMWTTERKNKARTLGLTPLEVETLASIVDEETNQHTEAPLIASVYLNRLKRQMPLGADPTVRYAVGDFSLRRLLNIHIDTTANNPYNTYTHIGLPPTPICTPYITTIDHVLNAPQTDYLYFCASSAFDGTHCFARTLNEHLRNAHLYHEALNNRGIKR